MKKFYLPIEEREENLDRAVEIALSEATFVGQPVYADFMGVPLVAVAGQRPDYTRDNWRKLFEQFQAGKPTCGLCHAVREPEAEPELEPEPATPAKKWPDNWWGFSLFIAFGLFVLFTVTRAVKGWEEDWDAAHAKPGFGELYHGHTPFITYDRGTGAITINVDEWKKLHGCSKDSILQTSETGFGGPHGNTAIELRPYCVKPN